MHLLPAEQRIWKHNIDAITRLDARQPEGSESGANTQNTSKRKRKGQKKRTSLRETIEKELRSKQGNNTYGRRQYLDSLRRRAARHHLRPRESRRRQTERKQQKQTLDLHRQSSGHQVVKKALLALTHRCVDPVCGPKCL
ncbi:hypothetical protein LZ31DRAFT_561153 [Colletotrichum somersetense]|nr:hypothetical protein LZ31DRAFT_561153 [Colletotrichum somersetense]